MSRPGPSPPPAFTPIASTSTAHLNSGTSFSGVRHRHEKEPATYPPQQGPTSPTTRPRRRKRREEKKKSRRYLRWRRGLVTEAFRKFGEHCARNQIRTLLIDCLVMTNLFYPSLALYMQKQYPPPRPPSPPSHPIHKIPLQGEAGPSNYWQAQQEHPLSLLNTPVLDSFFPYPPPLLPRLSWAGWWYRDTAQYDRDDIGWGLSRALPENVQNQVLPDEEIRIMRVAWADVEDVLDRDVHDEERPWEERDRLLFSLVKQVAEEWEEIYGYRGQACIRQMRVHNAESKNPCYVLSPNKDPQKYDFSQVALSELAFSSSITSSPSTQTDDSQLDQISNTGNFYHSFGTIFRLPKNSTNDFDLQWQQSIQQVAKKLDGELFLESQGSKASLMGQLGQWYLSYTSSNANTDQYSFDTHSAHLPGALSASPPKIVLFLYLVLFTTLGAQLSNASKVHSRFGLAFTGVVQLCCSTVMSFSVLALLGWNGWGASLKQSSLPTYVLPFVIVVVGAENMSTLTKAIFSIPFSHSVPVRIGLGLSKVGTTITFTSLTDLLVLGIVWLCVKIQPVREFCLFAAVVIIVDWFMLHTFFLTVLSIDAQRLELADVLASNGVPPISPVQQASIDDEQTDAKQGGFNWRKLLRARTTKSGSLVLLLMTVGLLYWLTERHRTPMNTTASLYGYIPASGPSATATHYTPPTPYVTDLSDFTKLNPAEQLWRSLNPLSWTFLKIYIPPASIIVLPKFGHPMRPADIRKLSLPASRLLLPRLRPLFYLFKVVIVPQALTAGALYMLLLYLLKDADLLDAQRDRLGRIDDKEHGNETDSSPNNQNNISEKLKANILPCSHETDIDLVSTSPDGLLTLTVGIDNTICLWRFSETNEGSGTRELLSNGNLDPADPIVASSISEDRRYIAICTDSGVMQIWENTKENQILPLLTKRLQRATSCNPRITAIAFDETSMIKQEDPFTITPTKASTKVAHPGPTVLIAYADGAIISFATDLLTSTMITEAQQSESFSVRTTFDRSGTSSDMVFTSTDNVQVYRKTPSGWLSTLILENVEDRITTVSTPNPSLPGLWAVGHKSGSIDVTDEVIGVLLFLPPHASSEPIRKIQLAKPATMKCSGCGTVTTDGYLVISSTATQVYFDRIASKSSNTIFCKCGTSRARSSLDEATRSNLFSPSSPSGHSNLVNGLVVPPSWMKTKYSPGTSPRKSPSTLPLPSNGEFPLSSHGGARRLSNLHKPDDSITSMTSTASMDKSSISGNSGLSPAGEFDIQSLGSIMISSSESDFGDNGNCEIINDEYLIGIKKSKEGSIDDSQWSIFLIDLTQSWNGFSLNVNIIQFDELLRTTKLGFNHINNNSLFSNKKQRSENDDNFSVSIHERRKERINSLNGKASFYLNDKHGSPNSNGKSVGKGKERQSFSVPTYEDIGYIQINQFKKFGHNSIIAAFGNKLGIIQLKPNLSESSLKKDPQKNASLVMGSNSRGSVSNNSAGMNLMSTPTPTQRRSITSSFPLAPPPPPSSNQSVRMISTNPTKKAD
ncbi:uncharacterized protein L201_002772 [Kwoniella dendrophila CBS 6074]|uniref:Sterol regulatory element-binding protein cleavage-activating protein n=1 Tax=Kwoniella dendrophila CBS 6074 TaxID=1295534 RepID=A0AAX4JSM1_9TREE